MKTNRGSIFIALAALIFVGAPVLADGEGPTNYFNRGAAEYIKGNKEPALEEVKKGLSIYTNDIYLIRLKEVIEREAPQQNQSQQDQNQQQDDAGKNQEDQKKSDQQDQQKDQPQPSDEKQSENQKDQAQPAKPEEMTPDEAALLLDAAKQQEQADREHIRLIMGQPVPVEKDW